MFKNNKTICYLGIGSNLGDRRKNIQGAVREIKRFKSAKVLKLSKIIETFPQGGPAGQNKYLNAALKVETNIPPFRLLKELKSVEKRMGRKKTVRWGPRVIDLDILFYGGKVVNSKNLKIPHPRIFQREFVLKPLLEVL